MEDNGKTVAECRSQATAAAAVVRYYAAVCETFEDAITPSRGDFLSLSTHEPRGVVAAVTPAVSAEARRIAEKIAEAFGYVGVLAVEMFVVKDGTGHAVLVNEIAPRVHNSGHWTIDGASVSQFEQHIRAVAGLPLGQPIRRGRVEMTNLLGDDVKDLGRWLSTPDAAVHLYGKTAVRPGRKMGHVTQVLAE